MHGSVDWRGIPGQVKFGDAVQAQRIPPPSHPEDASSGHELAGL